MVTARKTTRPRKAAPRKTAVKKTAPAKPVKKSSVVSKADLEKRLEKLQVEIIQTVEEYTEDGTLCDSERRNIVERFSELGVEFPKRVRGIELTYTVVISCPEMPYVDTGCRMEIQEDNKVQDDLELALVRLALPHDSAVQSVDLQDYDFDR